jgi:hypothetical protein
MSVEVLWLLVKPQCDWFLYTCSHIKAMILKCLFHRLEHKSLDCMVDAEELPTKTVPAFQEWFLQSGVSPHNNMYSLLVFIETQVLKDFTIADSTDSDAPG